MKYNEETYKSEINRIYNGEIEIIGHFKNLVSPILLKDKFGVMQIKTARLALDYKPGIKAALNKTEYFMNLLKDIHPNIANLLIPLSEYISMKNKMLFDTLFGLVSTSPDALIHGHIPNIRSAVNRKDYFKKQLLLLYDNKYDFEIESTDRHKGRVILICPIHGKQSVDNDTIFTKCGCPKCNKNWTPPNLFYLIKLYNEEESFYKLGVSRKLPNGKISRFASYKTLGYLIEELKIIQFKNPLDCVLFELEQKQLIKNNLYTPKHWNYNNSYETFLDSLFNSIINNVNNLEYDIVSTSMETLSSVSGLEVTKPNEDIVVRSFTFLLR